MNLRPLGSSGLTIAPLVFGANVCGWTIDERTSFEVLDAFIDCGFNAIDTADIYSNWIPGNSGGESETIIGRWLKARPGLRERVLLFTKVGGDMGGPGQKGLSSRWISHAVEHSLARLQTDTIDLYFTHFPDDGTPIEETLATLDMLRDDGKVRAFGASNLNVRQLSASLHATWGNDLLPYQVLQPEYNLYQRHDFESGLRDRCIEADLGVVTYFSLASGFLTGKYRSMSDLEQSPRGSSVEKYLNPRGNAILHALDGVAEAHSAKLAEVALAWIMAQRGVTAPIASATRAPHVQSFARAAELTLTADDLATLDQASA